MVTRIEMCIKPVIRTTDTYLTQKTPENTYLKILEALLNKLKEPTY